MLECAKRVFARDGYENAAMDEIAGHAGVSKPMLYAYFGSKDGLYLAALRYSGEQVRAQIRAGVDLDHRPEGRLWHGILALLDVVEVHPEWWRIAREALIRGGEPARMSREVHIDMMRLVGGEFAGAATQSGVGGTALTALDMLGTSFVGACDAAIHWWLEHPDVPKGTVALQLMNLAWMGFGRLLEGELWVPEEAREDIGANGERE
jgi:AcrR family transcriptional regulator